jgi:hypothetical protein
LQCRQFRAPHGSFKRRARDQPAIAATTWIRASAASVRLAKICLSCVSGLPDLSGYACPGSIKGLEDIMRYLPDHGLPLVQLKEQRRDLIVALQNRKGPISSWELLQIAAVQQAISAFEDVIADLDAELEAAA